MTPATLAWFVLGLVLLIAGAEMLVRGAARLAAAFGISPLVIGLTIVAFGTGSPELAVGVRSAAAGQADIALGNVIGSNIFNVLFILGVSATVVPLVVAQQLVRLDVPIMIAASAAVYLAALDHIITAIEGLLLFTGIVVYTIVLIRQSRRDANAARLAAGPETQPTNGGRPLASAGLIMTGLLMLFLGSRWLVNGAVDIATALGVSQLIIGLTIVAIGTSLPEVATSVVAGLRGQRDIAVGNVVGSNVYNILMVVGLASFFAPTGLSVAPAALNFDLPVMLAVAVACLPIFFAGHVIRRWEGVMFLGYWMAYTLFLILDASDHDALPEFSLVMSLFVIPLTVITIAVLLYRTVRAGRAA